jgi:hypothetical protein
MHRRRLCALALMLILAPFVAACQRDASRPAVTAADFHHSDPATVGTTGRPQLLEFFGPT